MEIPAPVSEAFPNKNPTDEVVNRNDSMVKIDPYRGSWEAGNCIFLNLSCLIQLMLYLRSVQLDNLNNECGMLIPNHENADFGYPKTRIDRDHTAWILIPLEHFKLPILYGSFFAKDAQTSDAIGSSGCSNRAERNDKAELNNLISKIKVTCQSGRNSMGELNIKDTTKLDLQASVMDILLPDPLTFGFRLAQNGATAEINGFAKESSISVDPPSQCANGSVVKCKGSISAHEMTRMEVIVRNNTKEMIQLSLGITCRDVAGENCTEGNNATVLCAGVLSDIYLEVPPLEEVKHAFLALLSCAWGVHTPGSRCHK